MKCRGAESRFCLELLKRGARRCEMPKQVLLGFARHKGMTRRQSIALLGRAAALRRMRRRARGTRTTRTRRPAARR